ncbi:type II toxin-antitoxin system HipA family toxin YjjJ [Actimicrobium sp. CCI2.3]|uniref:type II toxin-antitoxin system HipA family toxin YjjJ n=1 Tax=Actimicrobium sp. CCI2.3 TaxID=3048616 RepID=UPI002AB3DDCC|nr:type II toxin-antitoxin system HipA family toxin YjjJ [Actimicrobium sp. CCI2.3]MDY7576213.1 type II toxin-antitoxin system HipA family toxin YjjJ [Actimicrobium sp. CCI2.3]MEB0020582.1 type II toxin-antitoxin system HipA family toxin YjjJ [Actimicrobium sp. CCI2.3]
MLRRLLSRQPADAKTLSSGLGISQSTFSRLWPAAGNDICVLGAARSTRYGLTRPVRDLGSTLPVYRIDATGTTQHFCNLIVLAGHWHAIQLNGSAVITPCEGLPTFLQDLRPQGFLGRTVPKENADLDLPPDVLKWSDDDVLYYLARRGENSMGDLLVGSESYRRYRQDHAKGVRDVMTETDRSQRYPELAERALQGDVAGSSAGGEQPKFLATISCDEADQPGRHVLVKFSAGIDTPGGRRWGDLLLAEHHALTTLALNGIAAAKSDILISQNRVFLESTRFDRQGLQGRLPMLSLASLAGKTGALDKSWSYVANLLCNQRQLTASDLDVIQLLDLYGALIGNTDRHHGNLSLRWNTGQQFSLLPCYDMLPMLYRPNTQGEVVDRRLSLDALDKLDLRQLPRAAMLANQFWMAVLADERVSDDFKTVARKHLDDAAPMMR